MPGSDSPAIEAVVALHDRPGATGGPPVDTVAVAALDDARVAPDDLDLVLHGSAGPAVGADRAHLLTHRLGARRAVPVDVHQPDAGAAAVVLASARLRADDLRHALVVTADLVAPPSGSGAGTDPWWAVSALVLGWGRAELFIDAITSVAIHDASAEPGPEWPVRRGAAGAGPRPGAAGPDAEYVHGLTRHHVRRVVGLVLGQAGPCGRGSLEAVVLPALGSALLERAYRPALDGLADVPVVAGADPAPGAGGLVADLAAIRRRGVPGPGRAALLLSTGRDLTWTGLLVRSPQPG